MSFNNFTSMFNTLFFNLVDTVVKYFPKDAKLLSAQKSLNVIRKINPKLVFRVWDYYVATPYKKEIEAGDVEFFINKDYSSDLSDYAKIHDYKEMSDAIDRLREPVRNMNKGQQFEIMGIIQSLSKLADLHKSNNK